MSPGTISRRNFMCTTAGAGTTALGASVKLTLLEPASLHGSSRRMAASDKVRFGIIGTGVRGCELLQATHLVPGTECVATCDLYDSRHEAAREALRDKVVPTTRDYREILDRSDVDAVIVATSDHWHRRVTVDACNAGKDVYCEKPMSHSVEDGFAMVEAVQRNNRILQVGSQRVSSVLYAKAKEIYSSGKLGQVTAIEAYWDRNTPGGAWINPVPPDASPQTVDWKRFLGDSPSRPFDPVRFFCWRRFADYGLGLAGDLFVHLISGIHFITGTHAPPRSARSCGGLFRWKEAREFPDLLLTFFDYDSFRVGLRCNQNNEGGEFMAFYGTGGTLVIRDITSMPAFGFGAIEGMKGPTLTFTPQDIRPRPDGYSIYGWPKKLRDEYLREFREKHPHPAPLGNAVESEYEVYAAPPGYSDVPDHVANFFDSVRTRRPPIENEVFGNNAAIGCHLANHSYFHNRQAAWDTATARIKEI